MTSQEKVVTFPHKKRQFSAGHVASCDIHTESAPFSPRQVRRVHVELVHHVWPVVAPMIADALQHSAGHMRVEDVRGEIDGERRQLWVAEHDGGVTAMCVTRVAQYPAGTALFIQESAGTLAAVSEMWPHLRAYAKQWGCKTVCFYGRRGWSRPGALPQEFVHMSDFWVAEV